MKKLAVIAFVIASSLAAQVQIGKGVKVGGAGSGTGSVTNVTVTTTGGFQGTVASSTTTPAISISTDSTHVLPVNTGSAANCLSQAGTYVACGGSAGITALTGDVTGTGPGSTAATVAGLKNVPFCTGFTPTNGQSVTYTTSSSPNPCWTATTGSGSGTVSGQAANTVPLGTSATVIGAQSHITDDGTKVAISEPTQFSGSGPPISIPEAATNSGASAFTVIQALNSSHRLQFNPNNAGWLNAVGIATAGTANNCPKLAANGIDLVDSGAPCGSGGSGTVNSGTANQLAYYAGTGTAVSGTNAIPNGTTGTTQAPGDNSTKLATDAFVLANGAFVNPLPPGVGGAEYLMTEGSGTTVHDTSGNGNDATFGAGGAAPAWVQYGVAFSNGGITTNNLWIDTPLTNFGTVAVNYCTPDMAQTTGIGGGGYPSGGYPTLWGTTSGSDGVWLINSFEVFSNSVEPLVWDVSANTIRTSVTGWFGNCHIYIYAAGSPDIVTVDGVVQTVQSMGNTGSLTSTTGHYQIGNGQDGATSALRGVVAHVIVYPHSTVLTAAQQAKVFSYMKFIQSTRPGFPVYPRLTNAAGPQMLVAGSSLDAGYLGTYPWTNDLTLNRPYTFLTNNYGIGGSTAIDLCTTAEQRWMQGVANGNTSLFVDAPTNDMAASGSTGGQAALNSLAGCVSKAHALGARIFTATLISRANPSSGDASKNAYNPLIRANWKQLGFDGLVDFAETSLGADAAFSNTACFNADGVHLVGPGVGTCDTIGTSALSGYGIFAYLVSGIVNEADGAVYGVTPPNVTTSNAYVETYADGYLKQTPSGAATNTLVDCQGVTRNRVIINGSGSFAITVSDPTSHTINGSAVVAANTTGFFQPIPGSLSAAGCSWLRI